MLVVVQGPHDYVSSSWYAEGDDIPTWNHVTAHLYGVPEILSDEENFAVLSSLTDHFEGGFEHGRSLSLDEDRSRRCPACSRSTADRASAPRVSRAASTGRHPTTACSARSRPGSASTARPTSWR